MYYLHINDNELLIIYSYSIMNYDFIYILLMLTQLWITMIIMATDNVRHDYATTNIFLQRFLYHQYEPLLTKQVHQ